MHNGDEVRLLLYSLFTLDPQTAPPLGLQAPDWDNSLYLSLGVGPQQLTDMIAKQLKKRLF